MRSDETGLSRRDVLRAGVLGGAAFALNSAAVRAGDISSRISPKATGASAGMAARRAGNGSSGVTHDFNQDWRFGGVYVNGSQEPGYSDKRYARITVPHTVTPLSWGTGSPIRGRRCGSTASASQAPS